MESIADFFLVGGIVITLLILIILVRTKKRELSQNILIAFFLFLLMVAMNSYATVHDIKILFSITVLFDDSAIVAVGPLLYLYVKSIFHREKNFLLKNIVHFIPIFINLLVIPLPIFINGFYGEPYSKYIKIIYENINIIRITHNTYLITYLVLSLALFFRLKKAMKINFSNFSDNDFLWVKNMIIGALLVIIFDLFFILLEVFIPSYTWSSKIDLTVIAMIIFIVYLGFYGINQSKVLLPDFLINDATLDNSKNEKRNHLSNVSNQELQELKTQLEKILIEEKPYLDEDLTLNKLAKLIPTTDKKLSTFLNQHLKTTFYDIINKYRVESVKEKLHSNNYNNITLLGIAYESGFNSKTSFNRIFKKETGLSPSEYKKRI